MTTSYSCSRREFLASSCSLLATTALAPSLSAAEAPEPVIDIHQHTNYSGRTNEQLIRHQQVMGVTKTVLLPAGRFYGLDAKCGTNDTVVIGFDELRLNWKLPGATTTQLEILATRGAFNSVLPANPERISVPANPVLEKVEGFFHGNCAHCHNATNSTVFDLRYPTFVQNTVGQMTMGSGTTAGLRIDPGKPDNSILYRQITRMMLPPGLNPMPPVGVQRAPDEGLALLRKWILALPHP